MTGPIGLSKTVRAIAAHVRHEDGWFPIVLCVVFGALLWSGLLLRDAGLRAVLPWNR